MLPSTEIENMRRSAAMSSLSIGTTSASGTRQHGGDIRGRVKPPGIVEFAAHDPGRSSVSHRTPVSPSTVAGCS